MPLPPASLLGLLLAPAFAAERFDGRMYYLGDLHVHTGVSGDGYSSDLGGCAPDAPCGAFADVAGIARDNGLDFLSVTDHVNGQWSAADEDFAAAHALMLEADDPEGGFVTVPGAELSLSLGEDMDLGHYNLYLFDDSGGLADLTREDTRLTCDDGLVDRCGALTDYMEQLTARFGPALLIPHHPAGYAPMTVDWTCGAGAFTPAVEIYSEHGNALATTDGYDPSWSGRLLEGTIHHAMDPAGPARTLGFFAATDTHDTLPGDVCSHIEDESRAKYGGGLAVAVLEESEAFDRGALYRALVERRTYATTGPLIPVSVVYTSGDEVLGGLGEALPAVDALTAAVTVPPELAPYVLGVGLVGLSDREVLEPDGEGRWSVTLSPPEVFYIELRIDGESWYGEAGCDDGGEDAEERIWLSPSWVGGDAAAVWPEAAADAEAWDADCEAPEKGCGCAAPRRRGGGSGLPGLWLGVSLVGLVRRRRLGC